MLTASLLLRLAFTAAPLACDGAGAKDPAALEHQKSVESSAFFKLAVSAWGAPVACTAKARKEEARVFGTWSWRFKRGATFSDELTPPETVVDTFSFDRGLDNRMVDALFALDAVKQVNIHAGGKSQLDTDAAAGTTTERHWSSDEDLNAGIDLVRKAGKVIALQFHIAL